jgi:hypothetical protein
MKYRVMITCAAIALTGCLVINRGIAQDKSKDKAPKQNEGAPPGAEEMMKKMAEMAAPGPAHKALNPLAGEWNVSAKFWMGGPEPTESKGTSNKRWIMGERFLQEDFKGEFMGQPFQGMGLTGYDKMKDKYVGMWIDSMGTAMAISEGKADTDGKVITMNGTMDDPMSGEKNKPVKYILRIASQDKHVMEMHDLSLGDKSKMGEITYTRK